ncbi:MAG: hypothetical protein ACKOOA_11525, partial [Sediminibacterium sp.]
YCLYDRVGVFHVKRCKDGYLNCLQNTLFAEKMTPLAHLFDEKKAAGTTHCLYWLSISVSIILPRQSSWPHG